MCWFLCVRKVKGLGVDLAGQWLNSREEWFERKEVTVVKWSAISSVQTPTKILQKEQESARKLVDGII